MFRRIAMIVAPAFLAVGLLAFPAAADGEIGLSYDGVTWSTSLAEPLFDPDFRWVPGDSEERSFFVRNNGPSAAELTVDVAATNPDGWLGSPDFALEAQLGGGPWLPISNAQTVLQPVALDVPQGDQTTVRVRGTFSSAATGEMNHVVPFVVHLTMSEDPSAVAGEVEGVSDDGKKGSGKGKGQNDGKVKGEHEVGGVSDALPNTGASFGGGLLWLAAGLIGGGFALIRRRRDDEAAEHA